ncbi:LysR family transcriptional regulator [Shewanella schlegeliana]|uniref:LysR family transcriptional regulator n=1 Tax=Shewanella schlegeliana TaxID=190308 RepID=A0ABS1T1F6_9GAMM|nr:LysR family transcriptional regulator [Shewanella schlegeliana]MBL4914603.1 LysR family transcriptional regulator [Shewanella schlegeliana]MCL1109581.1 LysR family transcriptional regulator [Shewanella schlegeliana]GIU29783.1 LysR family transcriptional regulator [Shewanella schlegeliana]
MRDISLSDLDLLSINIFVNLYENKSATFVSHKLNVPAPKISRCLKHAREIFGNELFIRKKHGLVPNEFAGKVYPIAKEIVECSRCLQKLNNINELIQSRHFEILAPDLISYPFPKVLLSAIKNAGKDISFNISPWTKNSVTDIISGEADLGLCCSKMLDNIKDRDNSLNAIPLKKLNKLFLVCHHEHPILKEEITLESIAQYPFINSNMGNSEKELSPYQEFCLSQHIKLTTEMSLTGLTGLFEYLRSSQGIALLPYSSIFTMINNCPDLHACRLSDVESERLYMHVKEPNLYLVYSDNNEEPNLHWLASEVRGLVEQFLH